MAELWVKKSPKYEAGWLTNQLQHSVAHMYICEQSLSGIKFMD
jgi:hypothetical protein